MKTSIDLILKEKTELILDSLQSLYRVIFFTFIFGFGYYLFFVQTLGSDDLLLHLKLIDSLVHHVTQSPEFGFQYVVYFFSQIFNVSYVSVACPLLALMLMFTGVMIFYLLKSFLIITDNQAFLFTTFLLLVSAIYVPFFNPYVYLGQGSPNVWHSPTLIMVKPFAFLVAVLAINFLKTNNKSLGIITAFLLLLSLVIKPSFAIVFIPAFGIYLLTNYQRNLKTYLYGFLLVLPGLLLILYQYFLLQTFNTHLNSQEVETIAFVPFGFLHIYTPNVFVSFLLVMAFPLSLLLCFFKQVLNNKYLQLAWIMTVIGYLQMAFLVQPGIEYGYGNFSWGFLIALHILFVFSFIEFINCINSIPDSKLNRFKISFIAGAFSLHLVSGVYYFVRFLVYHNGL